jgi:mannose-1-phosphate guanylyltransferase
VRTKAFIRQMLGCEKPKQYCTFVGSRSMFQHMLDRAARLLQPKNVDTAAGIYLPLTSILARDPQATGAIYPSDHFISPEDPFLTAVKQAVQGSIGLGGRPVMLAV